MHKHSSANGSHAASESAGALNGFAPIPQLEPHFPASKGSIEWRPIAALLVFLAVVAGVALWAARTHHITQPSNSATTTTSGSSAYLVGDDKYVCGVAALRAVLCENVTTHAITKYEVPHALGVPYALSVSPDGSKILLSSFANSIQTPDTVQHFYVVDRNFTLIKQLPSALLAQGGYNYAWLPDSKSLVYDLRAGSGASQLHVYDVSTGKTRQLTDVKSGNGLDYPAVTRSGRIIAYGRGPTATTPEELAAISSADGSAQDIDTSAVYKNLDPQTRIFYSASSDLFYASGAEESDGSKDITIVARLVASGGTLKLAPLATYQKEFDTPPILTTAGMLLSTASTKSGGELEFYNGKDPVTKLSANFYMFNNGISGFAALPFAHPASTNTLTSSDYVYEYGTPPSRLDQFVRQLATKGCKPGQYMSVSLMAFDGDQQAAVEQGTCGNTGAGAVHYYEYKNGTYKDMIATEEGVSCQDAARLGISKVVLPDCAPADQGP